MEYHCVIPLRPDEQAANKNKIFEALGLQLPQLAPHGRFLFCYRRDLLAHPYPGVNLVWFRTPWEGRAWIERTRLYDYLSGTTEEFLAELHARKEETRRAPQPVTPHERILLDSATASRTVLGSVLLLVLAFFSWNYGEFFGPDSVYYFARRLDSWPTVFHAFSHIDDRGHYRPMGLFLFTKLFFPLFKYSVLGHHLIPLAFHAVNVFLVYAISLRLLRSRVGALGATAFFALHRINFFVTYGITFTPDFTGVFFLLAAFLCYLRRDEHSGWLGASLLLWTCALFSKEVAVLFPGILAGYELLLSGAKGRVLCRLTFRRTLPFWIIALGFVAIMMSLHGGSLYPQDAAHPYRAVWSASALIPKAKYLWWSLNLPQGSRITQALGNALGIEGMPIRRAFPHHTSVAALLLIPFMIAFALFVSRSLLQRRRTVLFGALYFLLALSPALPLAGRVMQHNLYFPLFGLAVLFGSFVDHVFKGRFRAALLPLIVVFLFSTSTGVINNRYDSWPVVASRTSARYLAQFHAAVNADFDCSRTAVVIAKTGQPDFLWYTDGGNLFRVFGPCPYLRVYFEDLGNQPDTNSVVILKLTPSPAY